MNDRFEDYLIISRPMGSHAIEFDVYEVAAQEDGALLYTAPDCGGWTGRIEEAEKQISGFIKWDGCSNWDFKTSDCMKHFCGRSDAEGIGRLLGKLYDIAARDLPTYDAELGG